LGDSQALGGVSEMASFGDGDEIGELMELHRIVIGIASADETDSRPQLWSGFRISSTMGTAAG